MYLALVVVHVLAAMVWVGGVLFLALVGAPALRRVEPAELRAALFASLGMRFRAVGWSAVVLLLVSGTALLHGRGWLTGDLLLNGDFWATRAGGALAWKLGLVLLMVLLTAVHDVALSPSRVLAQESDPSWPRRRRSAILLARAGSLAAVGAVIAAVVLARS